MSAGDDGSARDPELEEGDGLAGHGIQHIGRRAVPGHADAYVAPVVAVRSHRIVDVLQENVVHRGAGKGRKLVAVLEIHSERPNDSKKKYQCIKNGFSEKCLYSKNEFSEKHPYTKNDFSKKYVHAVRTSSVKNGSTFVGFESSSVTNMSASPNTVVRVRSTLNGTPFNRITYWSVTVALTYPTCGWPSTKVCGTSECNATRIEYSVAEKPITPMYTSQPMQKSGAPLSRVMASVPRSLWVHV